jgi:predicted ATPase
LEVPRNVRLVVGRRLGRLGEATRKILAVAAVIGRSFTFELLEAATSAKADALLDCLDEAHRIGLVRSSTQYLEARFEFSHELIRQAILTQLSVARHRRLHFEVAETIERLYSKRNPTALLVDDGLGTFDGAQSICINPIEESLSLF